MNKPQDHLAEQDVVRRVDDVTSALEGLVTVLGQEEDLSVVLRRACLQAVQVVPDADLASIALVRDGAHYTATSTGDAARRIDQAQYDAGQGRVWRPPVPGRSSGSR
jgi:hypothetical protein